VRLRSNSMKAVGDEVDSDESGMNADPEMALDVPFRLLAGEGLGRAFFDSWLKLGETNLMMMQGLPASQGGGEKHTVGVETANMKRKIRKKHLLISFK